MTATHHRRNIIKSIILLVGLLLGFISNTNPSTLPVILLVLPVILVFVILSLSFYLLLGFGHKVEGAVSKKNILYSFIGSGVISIGLLLRSINQLNGRDILLGFVFLVIASIYAKKFKLSVNPE